MPRCDVGAVAGAMLLRKPTTGVDSCARGQRTRRRAAEQRDEFAPSHVEHGGTPNQPSFNLAQTVWQCPWTHLRQGGMERLQVQIGAVESAYRLR
jgi:hypothetical protein